MSRRVSFPMLTGVDAPLVARVRFSLALTLLLLIAASCGLFLLANGVSNPTQAAASTNGGDYGGGRLMSADASGGYWMSTPTGAVDAFAGATLRGSIAQDIRLSAPVVGMATTPDGGGYWLVASDGGVFTFGDAHFYGSTGALHLNQPIVAMATTPDGGGYWLVASDGGVFTFGDAHFYGSTGALHLNQPIVAMATPDSGGYWLAASDGGVFTFGDAHFYGSTGALHLNQPIVAMATSPDGGGYWLVASDGGVFTYGDSSYFGSLAGGTKSVVGLIKNPQVAGYTLVETGGVTATFPTTAVPPSPPVLTPTATTTTETPAPATSTTSTTTTTTGPPNSSGNGSNCGGVPVFDGQGTQLTCTFDDEFNGTSLDTSKWVVQQTATSGYTDPGPTMACFVNSPNNVSVSGGYLNLTVRQEAAPFACPVGLQSFPTSYTSGMVTTYGLFSQAYGTFEVRAKLPPSSIQGLQETFWLWPVNSSQYGTAWPASGEIDFAEFYSQFANLDIPYIHYNAAVPDANVTASNCTITPGTFNTYGLEWSPGSLVVTYNGHVCLVDHPNPAAPLTGAQPFDKPFMVSLTQTLGIGSNVFEPGKTPLPATTQVDWVRVWS
jgi:beta-glucanase (GH16 family)